MGVCGHLSSRLYTYQTSKDLGARGIAEVLYEPYGKGRVNSKALPFPISTVWRYSKVL